MENQKATKFDIDIEIKDLLWEFVRRWRVIIVLAVIFGIALTAYQYRADMNTTEVVVIEKSIDEVKESLGKQDLDEVTGAVALRRQLDQKSEYMENSVLMQINPYEENVVLLQYYILGEKTTVENIVKAYKEHIENGTLSQNLVSSGMSEIESAYLMELACIDNTGTYAFLETSSESITMGTENTDDTSACFVVKVRNVDAESTAALAKNVEAELNDYAKLLNNRIAVHELVLIQKGQSVVVDLELAELQNHNALAIKNLNTHLDKMKTEMTADQITLYTYEITLDNVVTQEVVTDSAATEKTVGISIKHLVIGVILGVVLACVYIFAAYLMTPALRSEKEVKILYKTNVLGKVKTAPKKRVFGFVDGWIHKLEHRRTKSLTFEEQLQMICSNIKVQSRQNNGERIYLSGSIMEQIPENILKQMTEKCQEKGIQLIVGESIVYNALELEKSADIGKVVFIEQKKCSLYDEIYKEVELCRENNIDVVGMIILEA